MRIKLIFTMLALKAYTLSFPQWIELDHGFSISQLYSVDCIESEIVYAAGEMGDILKSTDGGISWSELSSGIGGALWEINFVNSNLGFCVGQNGTIIRTIDGGINWNSLDSGINESLYTIFIVNENILYVGGWYGILIKSTDGGDTWSSQNLGVYAAILDIFFLSNDFGYAVGGLPGGSGVIIKTTNGGISWSEMVNSQNWNKVNSVYFHNESFGFVTSGFSSVGFGLGEIFQTSDGGVSWNKQFSGQLELHEILFINENLGFVAGNGGTILKTTNYGNTWILENTPTTVALRSIDFTESTNGFSDGYAVGVFGVILKKTGISSIKNERILFTSYILSQNFPNPFNPNTTIKYQLPGISFVTLKVFDVLGNEIATLVNEEKPAGSYEVKFTVGQESLPVLPSGIYFYQLRAGDFVKTKKMVLLR